MDKVCQFKQKKFGELHVYIRKQFFFSQLCIRTIGIDNCQMTNLTQILTYKIEKLQIKTTKCHLKLEKLIKRGNKTGIKSHKIYQTINIISVLPLNFRNMYKIIYFIYIFILIKLLFYFFLK